MIVRDENTGRHPATRDPRRHCTLLSWALMVLALVMTLPNASSYAAGRDPLILQGPADIAALGQHFEYTIDADWQLKVADFLGAPGIETQPLPGNVPDFGYTPARIWLKLGIVNGTPDVDAWRFFVHANFTQKIAIYRIGADGAVTTLLDLTEDTPFSARPIDYPQMVTPFDLAPGEAATLVIAYYSQGSSRLSMSIETPDSFAAMARVSDAKSYAFYGMMLVMIALATVALVALRQPVFAAYAGYLVFVFIYVAHADGMAFQYIWPDFPRFNSMASIVAGSGGMICGGLFAIAFLQTARFHPILHRVLLTVVVGLVAVDIVLWATDPQLLKRLLVLMLLVCSVTFVAAAIVAARTRFREVRFYLFAWFAALIPACLFTARYGFGFEPSFITTYDAIRLALLFDALMMGLAVFDHYNRLRQSAAEDALANAQRNLLLSQRLASLEENYQQVTASAHQREESVKDTIHDLRQPMHALRLSLRQMISAKGDNAQDAGQIESALGYMERLVAERLADDPRTKDASPPRAGVDGEAAKIAENGEGRAATEPGLHAVLRGIADMFAGEAAEKGLGLKLVLAAQDAEVAAYPLMRVAANLVSNAIKYTGKGRVLIGLRRSGSGHRVEIHDTGPGLSGPAFEQALLRNQRLDRDLAAAEGSGLGLAVAKQIAEANGWTLTACPIRRTGASLRLEMPTTRQDAPPPLAKDRTEASARVLDVADPG